nr:surface-adhesin E family protein [Plesiomonas shigelloides]
MNRLGKLAEVRLRGVNTVPFRSSHKQSSVQSSSHVSWVSQVTWVMWGGLSVFTLLALMVSISAQAAEETWKPLGSTADGQVYVDTMTAMTDDKGITHAQVRLDYVSPTEIGTLLLVGQQSQVRLDCAQKQSATDRISVTQQDGKRFIMASYEAAPFEQIPAGSANALLMSELCSRSM